MSESTSETSTTTTSTPVTTIVKSIFSNTGQFLSDRLNATLAVSLSAIAFDIAYHVLQRRLRTEALIEHIQEGDKGRSDKNKQNREGYCALTGRSLKDINPDIETDPDVLLAQSENHQKDMYPPPPAKRNAKVTFGNASGNNGNDNESPTKHNNSNNNNGSGVVVLSSSSFASSSFSSSSSGFSGLSLSSIVPPLNKRHEIDRRAEARRVMHQLSHRGAITVIMQNTGTGVTSLMKDVARHRPSTSYISLAGAKTLDDVCVLLQRELNLEADEKLPTTFFIASRLLRGLTGVLGSAEVSSEEAAQSSDLGSADSEVSIRWVKLTKILENAAEEASLRNVAEWVKKSRDNIGKRPASTSEKNNKSNALSSEYILLDKSREKKNQEPCNRDDDDDPSADFSFLSVPLLIFDDAIDLDQNAYNALATFAHHISSSGKFRIAFIVSTVYPFFASRYSHTIKTLQIRPPSAESVAHFIMSRCPFLKDEGVAMAIVERLTGRNIGIVNMVCMKLEEILCDSEIPLSMLDADEMVRTMWFAAVRLFAFATTRPLHLYSLQPIGVKEVDEERLGVFRVAIMLLEFEEDRSDRMARCRKQQKDETEENNHSASERKNSHVCGRYPSSAMEAFLPKEKKDEKQRQQQQKSISLANDNKREIAANVEVDPFDALVENAYSNQHNETIAIRRGSSSSASSSMTENENKAHGKEENDDVDFTSCAEDVYNSNNNRASGAKIKNIFLTSTMGTKSVSLALDEEEEITMTSETLGFSRVLEGCPLRVWLRLIENRRPFLPFFVSFDAVLFRAPLYRLACVEVVGASRSSKARIRALEALKKLEESIQSE